MKITGQWLWLDSLFCGIKTTKKWQLINLLSWSISLRSVKKWKTTNSSQWQQSSLQLRPWENVSYRQESTKIWSVRPNLYHKTSAMWWNASEVRWRQERILRKCKIYFLISWMWLRRTRIVIASWMCKLSCNTWLLKSSSHSMNQRSMMISLSACFRTLQGSSLMNLSIKSMIDFLKWLFWFFLTKD